MVLGGAAYMVGCFTDHLHIRWRQTHILAGYVAAAECIDLPAESTHQFRRLVLFCIGQ